MNSWLVFWTIWLVLSGIAFAVITAVVAVRGAVDLRRMLRGLREQRERASE
ncbi:MAG TPA: hypothetical protein VFQ00_00075 [Terriglobales bacterium]|nr:hypothetical protein [Terriglobales bacterium]